MPRFKLAIPALASIWLLSGLAAAHSGEPATQVVSLTIEDFSYLDTSGEPTDQSAAHQMRLQAFMTALRHDIETDNRYHLQAGANIQIIGAIQKKSTLVQWARVRAIDVAANRIVLEKVYTFRGDTDQAWQRAEAFVSEDIRGALVPPEPAAPVAISAPIKLAIFDFELDDNSAAPSETPSDATELAKTTEAVRELLTQSGRYAAVPISSGETDAVKNHRMHDCDGCEAKVARDQGADQSLVGVIGRVSRTEYTVSFRLRDARTGAIVAGADSGLRMGANYSWSRGAMRLIRDQLLEVQARQ
jgi:Protein of unknown function (DUF2380)